MVSSHIWENWVLKLSKDLGLELMEITDTSPKATLPKRSLEIIRDHILIRLNISHLNREKQSQNVKKKKSKKKILVVAGESSPGTLALATELRQPTTSKTFTFYLYTVE